MNKAKSYDQIKKKIFADMRKRMSNPKIYTLKLSSNPVSSEKIYKSTEKIYEASK